MGADYVLRLTTEVYLLEDIYLFACRQESAGKVDFGSREDKHNLDNQNSKKTKRKLHGFGYRINKGYTDE